jgi:hypothetical protein
MVSEASMVSQSQVSMVNQGMVEQTGMVDSSMVCEIGTVGMVQDGMVNECMVSEVGVVGQVSCDVGGMTSTNIDCTTIQTVPTIMVESQQSLVDSGCSMQVVGTVDQSLDTSMQVVGTMDQSLDTSMEIIGTVDPGVTMQVVGTIPDQTMTTYPDGSTMQVIGTVSPAPPSNPSVCGYPLSPGPIAVSPAPPSEQSVCVYPVSPDPGYTVDTIGMIPGNCAMCESKSNEIVELETKITTMKQSFEDERTEVCIVQLGRAFKQSNELAFLVISLRSLQFQTYYICQ